jgi:hypothetical protein
VPLLRISAILDKSNKVAEKPPSMKDINRDKAAEKPPSMKDINTDCPSGGSSVSECHSVWHQIQLCNDDEVKTEGCYILPFCCMHHFVYKHRPLLPLAMARPLDMPGLNAPPFAFKFVFCPGGIKNTVHRSLKIMPNVPAGFLKSAIYFMQARFKRETNLDDIIKNGSSIWLLGVVKNKKEKWTHQTLGGVICTSCAGTGKGSDAPASFVHCLAVQEPVHDHLASENCPEISQDCYGFSEGVEFDQPSKDQLRDYFGASDNPLLGSRRMGVTLLSTVQKLSPSKKHMCHLHLQSLKQTFAYRRCMRLGFKYSTLHQKNMDGSSNTTWPGCRSTSNLPKNLSTRVLDPFCCCGEKEIHTRLLVLTEGLARLCPPVEKFGSPKDMKDVSQASYFEKWRFSCMLPDPVPEMSCNHSSGDGAQSLFQVIKEAFHHKGACAPNRTTTPDDWTTSATAADICSVFGKALDAPGFGVGYGINHLLACDKQPELPAFLATDSEAEEAEGSAACFWVSTAKALCGDHYAIDCMEFKVNILDLLARFSDIHPDNPVRQEARYAHGNSLCEEAEIRTVDDDLPVTHEELLGLHKHDMDDMNMASLAAQQIVNSHFLKERCKKASHLLILTAKKRKVAQRKKRRSQGSREDFCVEMMSPSMMEAVAEDDASNAQCCAIANINRLHYINLKVKRPKQISATEAGGSSSAKTKQKKEAATGPEKEEFKYMTFDGQNYFGKCGRSSRCAYPPDPASLRKEERKLCKKKSNLRQWNLLLPGNSSGIENSPPDECADVPIQYQAFEKSCLVLLLPLHFTWQGTRRQHGACKRRLGCWSRKTINCCVGLLTWWIIRS